MSDKVDSLDDASVVILTFLFTSVCVAQPIRIRVINGKDGRSLPKQPISVQFLYETPPSVSVPLHLETDSNGEARFSIPEPTPSDLDVRIIPTSEHWHCACWMMAYTDTVVRKGIVQIAPYKAKATAAAIIPEPAVIVFVLHPLSLVERLLYPFAKE